MQGERVAWDSDRVNDFIAIGAAMLLLVLVGLRGYQQEAPQLLAVVPAIAFLGYLVTFGRHAWLHLSAAGGILVSTLVAWAFSILIGPRWSLFNPSELLWLVVVWAPWPNLQNRRSLLVIWALALSPLALILLGPPVADVTWLEQLVTGERIAGPTGFNEIGIPAGLGVIAALSLRLERDTVPRLLLQAACLVLAAGAGTRSIIPGLGVAAILWLWHVLRTGRGHSLVVELSPWVLYGAAAFRPALLRTVDTFSSGGLGGASEGRGDLALDFLSTAREALAGGLGVGATETLIEGGPTQLLPHNGFITLLVDVGVVGMLIAVAGLATLVFVRCRDVAGRNRWLLRVPLALYLPMLFLVDHGLWKPYLVVPILLYASAAPWVGRQAAVDEDYEETAMMDFVSPRKRSRRIPESGNR